MSFLLLENGDVLLLENGSNILLDEVVPLEFRIVNNLIVDADRETAIVPIATALIGTSFKPFSADTMGLGYFEVGDRIIVKDPNGVEAEVVILDITINITGGVSETILAKTPDKTKTDYDTAGIIGRRIRNTEIIVNKQKGLIEILNADMEGNTAQISILTDSITNSISAITEQVNNAQNRIDANEDSITIIQEDVTELQQTAEALTLKVSQTGGINLIKNSAGLKESIEEWQLFDTEGDLIDADNDATIDQTSDTTVNTESGSAFFLAEQYIQQTISTIEGEMYTLYFRYKSAEDTDITLTGVSGGITLPESLSWATFKRQFTATGSSTTLNIDNTAYTDGELTISDIVIVRGDINGWVQAPNEVYGKGFRFDKDGFSITSQTDPFKSLLDNRKFAVYDTSSGSERVILLVDKDSGTVTKLTVQDYLIIQRYQNAEKSTRIIPTNTGGMLVVNN